MLNISDHKFNVWVEHKEVYEMRQKLANEETG